MIGDLTSRLLRFLAPETAHRLTIRALRWGLAPAAPAPDDPVLTSELWGLRFRSPIGLAAGFDKNAEVPGRMAGLGFGFVEVGSITPKPQLGNPTPRLFRLPADRAVINRMGFNNDGLAVVRPRLEALGPRACPIGVNLGANKDSDDRIADYVAGMAALAGLADYVVINVSSPNTPGLRELQSQAHLRELLAGVRRAAADALGETRAPPPILVKIAPDFSQPDLAELAETLLALAVDGVIISNTSVGLRQHLHDPRRDEPGGLSGRPLFALSTECLGQFYRLSGGKLPLIGVGGIDSADGAYAKIRAGASLVQLYTGLVYEGPGLIRRLGAGLAERLRRDGFANVAEAVGADWK